MLLQRGESIESIHSGDKKMSLIVSDPSGLEMILHEFPKGSHWLLRPEEGWTATECVFLISGRMQLKKPNGEEVVVQAGDSLSYSPVNEFCIFEMLEDSQFIYTSTEPVFHMYSNQTQALLEMAITISMKDGYTRDHCERIQQLSMKLGKKMKLSNTEYYPLICGSLFHDLGKVKIPDHILLKPGKLTQEEYEEIKLHTVYGAEILRDTKLAYLANAAQIVEQHHERFDGKGYPYGLKAEQIHIGAAIVSVVDSFDAMTTDRVYQKARTKDEAIEEILRHRGTMYHPDVVDAFISMMKD